MEPRITSKGGSEMVLVPAGKFIFGMRHDHFERLYRDSNAGEKFRKKYGEYYQEEISLPDFYIDTYPVTNEKYLRFLKEAKYRKKPRLSGSKVWGAPRQPVVAVDWADAESYAK